MPQRYTLDDAPPIADAPEEIARDVLAVNQLEAVPTLLDVLCEITGMRFAAIARVTEAAWTACVVKDNINLGLKAGGQLDVEKTLCIESKRANASSTPAWIGATATILPRRFLISKAMDVCPSSWAMVDILAISSPSTPLRPKSPLRKSWACSSALPHLSPPSSKQRCDGQAIETPCTTKRAASELREQFIAILGHDLRNPLQAILSTSDLMGKRLPIR
jgi:hypothetical protein